MSEVIECIEFGIEELQALQQAKNLAFILKVCFLYGSDEAFHALCAIVEYGKDLSATSKRIKRDARVDLYRKLVVSQFAHVHDPVHKSLTYQEFAMACLTFSDRWRTQFPFDELLSLAFIVDKEEKGYINLEIFMAFIDDVDKAFHSNPSYPNVALDGHYDSRRETLFKHVMCTFESVELRNKLAYLASLACQFQVQPLTALFDMLQTTSETTNEHLIGFVVQLTGTVNHGIKQLEAAQLHSQGDLYGISSPLSSPPASVHSEHISPIGSPTSSTEEDRHIVSAGQGYESYILDQSYNTAASPPVEQDSVLARENSHPHEEDAQRPDAAAGGATNEEKKARGSPASKEVRQSTIADEVPPASAAALQETMQAFQNNAQQILESLAAAQVSADTPPAAEEAPASGADQKTTQEGTPAAVLSGEPGTPVAQLAAPPATSDVLPHVLLQQIQQMEAQLSKAKQIVLPILGINAGGPESDELATPRSASRLSRRPSSSALRSPAHAFGSSSSKHLSLLSPGNPANRSLYSPSPRGWNSSRKGGLNDTHISFSSTTKPSGSMSAKKFMELNLSHSKSIAESGHLDRSSPLVRHVDLSIFKSPMSHKALPKRNVFDDTTLTWIPGSGGGSGRKKGERFQSTVDLMVAREVNPVFFSTDL